LDYILLGVLAAMILLLVSQNRKRKKEAMKLLDSIQVGSKVLLISGLKGTVTLIEDDEIEIETTPGVKLRAVRQAVRSIETATEGN
jgi:preprotein translocase subunit YajC